MPFGGDPNHTWEPDPFHARLNALCYLEAKRLGLVYKGLDPLREYDKLAATAEEARVEEVK